MLPPPLGYEVEVSMDVVGMRVDFGFKFPEFGAASQGKDSPIGSVPT